MATGRRFLEALSPSSIKLGLERVHAALEALGHPERAYPSLHIAGTNGKGSTCAFLASCLRAQGLKVGLYTSPHLERVNERFRIDGEPIDDALLDERIEQVRAKVTALQGEPASLGLTYFEVGTLVALWHFAQERVDVAVLETGLGGRLDATNAVTPEVAIITPISLDHQDYLGDTLAKIAAEKAGILEPGVPVVVGRQDPEALAVIEAKAQEVGAMPVRVLGRDFDVERVSGEPLGLEGPHQRDNAACAREALSLLGARVPKLKVSAENVVRGLAGTRWPGRLERLALPPPLTVLDGAHNPAGAHALAEALEDVYGDRRVHLVFGVLADKDHGPMMRTLFPRCATVHLTPVGNPRSLDPSRYEGQARALNAEVTVHPDALAALLGARARAEEEELVVCAGSLFLIGQLRVLAGRAIGT